MRLILWAVMVGCLFILHRQARYRGKEQSDWRMRIIVFAWCIAGLCAFLIIRLPVYNAKP